jgi:hypothetical protein
MHTSFDSQTRRREAMDRKALDLQSSAFELLRREMTHEQALRCWKEIH